MKNILIISRSDIEGAGSVATDLRNFLISREESDIRILTRFSKSKLDYVISFYSIFWGEIFLLLISIKFKLDRKIRKSINFNYSPHSINEEKGWYKTSRILRKIKGFRPDIIIVLFMDGFVNIKNIYEIHKKTGASIYFYPMDMALMTGGCHYVNDCVGYRSTCNNCPIFRRKKTVATSNLRAKAQFFKKFPFKILSASEEIKNQLLRSSLFKDASIYDYIIPINEKVFYNKRVNRNNRLINNTKKILVGAHGMNSLRKGGDLLIKILNKLYLKLQTKKADGLVEIIIVGKVSSSFTDQISFKTHELGRVSLEELSELYNLSDIFISTSREDSGPMMINQSIMCGTPVISFNVGVAKNLILNFKTGFLIEKFNLDEFADKIEYTLNLNQQEYSLMKINCLNLMKDLQRVNLQ